MEIVEYRKNAVMAVLKDSTGHIFEDFGYVTISEIKF